MLLIRTVCSGNPEAGYGGEFYPSENQEEHTVDAMIVMGEISREYIHFMKKHTDVPVIFLDL